MGLYGSQPLHAPDYHPENPWKHCDCCGNQYQGNYCPMCGTKAGEKKPNRATAKWALALFFEGAIFGAVLLILISVLSSLH